MKKLIWILFITFAKFSTATTYIPCTEDETGTCWPCGKTCSARLSYPNDEDKASQKNATLIFSGEGEMYGYESPSNNPQLIGVEPWYHVRTQIIKVTVEEGITSVGARSVYSMPNLEEISLPESVLFIDTYAFNGAKSLKKINIPENLNGFGYYVFQNNLSLGDLSFSEKLINKLSFQNKHIFSGAKMDSLYCPEQYKEKCQKVLQDSYFSDSEIENVLKYYTKSGNKYFYKGKFYKTANDIAEKNNIKFRINTIDEANQVAGKTNTFSIRYR